ncbi:fk506 binding protein, putative [Pediculus humanus corporis]|uniref:peptidylprolyl isomerase n=1 Tax=Pediculus humanus subsp. corporis TaxID=121224 RepID=E0VH54_PEDHC|nr:fk506 binding protein, putative [Pediculus humanus corporis]EEB12710.1 fk506 binding protein, putative [Pediculus humanus corporis]
MPAVQLSDDLNVADSSVMPKNEEISPTFSNSTAISENDSENNGKNDSKASKCLDEPKDEWIDILGNGQLKLKTIKQGEPDSRPQANDICEIRLLGKLNDGKIVENFDSLKIELGSHEVVQGVELAVPLMNVGEEAIVVVSPRFGYGSVGNLPKIPPNATITYEVTLVNVLPEPNLEKISFTKRKILANNKKERGNWWYSRQDATKATQCYRKALNMLDETIPFCEEDESTINYTDDQVKEIIEQKLVIYNNLAAAQLMLEAYESALMSVNRVLQCDSKNVKALFRKGKILAAKGEINKAVEVLRQAYLLEPENSAIKMELSRCVKLQQTEKQHEKKLYRKMFGQEKNDGKFDKNSKLCKIIPKVTKLFLLNLYIFRKTIPHGRKC